MKVLVLCFVLTSSFVLCGDKKNMQFTLAFRVKYSDGNPARVKKAVVVKFPKVLSSRLVAYSKLRVEILLIECFHMTSRQPYCCSKTMKRWPVGVPNQSSGSLTLFLCKHFLLFQ